MSKDMGFSMWATIVVNVRRRKFKALAIIFWRTVWKIPKQVGMEKSIRKLFFEEVESYAEKQVTP